MKSGTVQGVQYSQSTANQHEDAVIKKHLYVAEDLLNALSILQEFALSSFLNLFWKEKEVIQNHLHQVT